MFLGWSASFRRGNGPKSSCWHSRFAVSDESSKSGPWGGSRHTRWCVVTTEPVLQVTKSAVRVEASLSGLKPGVIHCLAIHTHGALAALM